jgi:hypothetical protein
MWTGQEMLDFLRVKKQAWDNRLFQGLPRPFPSIQDCDRDLTMNIIDMEMENKELEDVQEKVNEEETPCLTTADADDKKNTDSDITSVVHRLPSSVSSPALCASTSGVILKRSNTDCSSSTGSVDPPPPPLSRPPSALSVGGLGGSSSTFGGGVLDSAAVKTFLLPARSTYPVNPRIRDELIRQAGEEEGGGLDEACAEDD